MKHMRACCPPLRPRLQHAVCALDVHAVGVLDQDEAFAGFSSASRRTATALQPSHPPVVALPSELMGIFFTG